MCLAHLEFLSIDHQEQDFPMHYHDTFCISYIHSGIEQTRLTDKTLLCEAGSISITHPFEVHATPVLDKDIRVSFETLYLADDLVRHFLNGATLHFSNRVLQSPQLVQCFFALKTAYLRKDPKKVETCLHAFIKQLQRYSDLISDPYNDCIKNFNEINQYIENHLTRKISLDDLARMANINKFGFVKKFRIETGMTPMNYFMMKKIQAAKATIGKDSELTQIAYNYNFTDMAHFSKAFKRYIGIAPKTFQRSLG